MKTYWVNESQIHGEWVQVSEETYLSAVEASGQNKGFFAGNEPTTFFSTPDSAVTYKRGEIRNS